jgi:hypothetical protein
LALGHRCVERDYFNAKKIENRARECKMKLDRREEKSGEEKRISSIDVKRENVMLGFRARVQGPCDRTVSVCMRAYGPMSDRYTRCYPKSVCG